MSKKSQLLIFFPIFFLLFYLCYHEIILWWYERVTGADSYYSHGFLVPIVSGYLVWLNRNNLSGLESGFSLMGLFVIIFALFMHIVGTIVYIFSVSGFSALFLVIGVSMFLFGLKKTRQMLFPLVFLIFMIPIPMALLTMISFPLKIGVAQIGTEIVRILGVPIYREGFNIFIPAGQLIVGNPCSGLRSLISFLALGAVFAYFLDTTYLKKSILFLLSIPIAIFSNILRVPALIMISHYWGLDAAAPETLVHTLSGVVMFAVGMGLLVVAARILEKGLSYVTGN